MRPFRIAAALLASSAFALFASSAAAQTTRVFITSGTTYVVPNDWNSEDNTVEVIGPGGIAKTPRCSSSPTQDGGGGGGAYAKISNLVLVPGATVSVHFGVTPNTANALPENTWFVSNVTALAEGGWNGDSSSRCSGGGRASVSVGTIKFDGGNGSIGNGGGTGAGGGGGAAGPHGAGLTAPGSDGPGGAGDAGFGGAGGLAGGGAGGNGTGWDATHGSGGGGGGDSVSLRQGAGGNYGGGTAVLNGTPTGGIIVLTYTPRRRVSTGAF